MYTVFLLQSVFLQSAQTKHLDESSKAQHTVCPYYVVLVWICSSGGQCVAECVIHPERCCCGDTWKSSLTVSGQVESRLPRPAIVLCPLYNKGTGTRTLQSRKDECWQELRFQMHQDAFHKLYNIDKLNYFSKEAALQHSSDFQQKRQKWTDSCDPVMADCILPWSWAPSCQAGTGYRGPTPEWLDSPLQDNQVEQY